MGHYSLTGNLRSEFVEADSFLEGAGILIWDAVELRFFVHRDERPMAAALAGDCSQKRSGWRESNLLIPP